MRALSLVRHAAVGALVFSAGASCADPRPVIARQSCEDAPSLTTPCVVNLVPELTATWARIRGQPREAQVVALRRELIEPRAIFYGEVLGPLPDAQLAAFAAMMDTASDRVDAAARDLERRMPAEWTRFTAVLPDAKPAVVYLLPSFGVFDGQVRPVGGRTVVLFGADAAARTTSGRASCALVQHELFHLYHGQQSAEVARGTEDVFVRRLPPALWSVLWVEGVATHASRSLCPDALMADVLLSDSLEAAAQRVMPGVSRAVRARLDSREWPDLAAFFFSASTGAVPDVPPRAGYWLGMRVAERVGAGLSLPQLARRDSTGLRREVEAALVAGEAGFAAPLDSATAP
jgi:hypothetical protein